jgi:hypothetical protein
MLIELAHYRDPWRLWYCHWQTLGFRYEEPGMSLCSKYDLTLLAVCFLFTDNSA